MEQIRQVAVIGDEEIGKTTLINALLGWDILPQSNDGYQIPTEKCETVPLTDSVRLTDTPGYCLLWGTVPEATVQAVSQSDTLIVMLNEELAEEDVELPVMDPEWETRRSAEAELLARLLAGRKNKDVYFVIPYDEQDWPEGTVPLEQPLRYARARFASMTCHAEAGFFCIDPMKALIAAIEDDAQALAASGILPLKACIAK